MTDLNKVSEHWVNVKELYSEVNRNSFNRSYDGLPEYIEQLQIRFRNILNMHYELQIGIPGEYEDIFDKFLYHKSRGVSKQSEYKLCLEKVRNWCHWVLN